MTSAPRSTSHWVFPVLLPSPRAPLSDVSILTLSRRMSAGERNVPRNDRTPVPEGELLRGRAQLRSGRFLDVRNLLTDFLAVDVLWVAWGSPPSLLPRLPSFITFTPLPLTLSPLPPSFSPPLLHPPRSFRHFHYCHHIHPNRRAKLSVLVGPTPQKGPLSNPG
jgi:hypothetical protein